MSLSTLSNAKGAKRASKRVGRGEASGHGKTCGRGQKGQMSRSGHKHKPGFEGGQMRLIRRIPKRGFTSRNLIRLVPVNLSDLAAFGEGATVDVEALMSAGIVKDVGAGVKLLGDGDVKHKLTVKVHAFSGTAKAKIEAAGGTCEVLSH
ncbi:MAG: 50S ribosomal protein L15 [bacterium]